MSRPPPPLTEALTGFPRVSGDEPWSIAACDVAFTFSPRERG